LDYPRPTVLVTQRPGWAAEKLGGLHVHDRASSLVWVYPTCGPHGAEGCTDAAAWAGSTVLGDLPMARRATIFGQDYRNPHWTPWRYSRFRCYWGSR